MNIEHGDRPVAWIDLSALAHNVGVVRQKSGPNRKILAVIKANAYGHGLLPIARALSAMEEENIYALGVTSMDEALILRKAQLEMPIVVMMGCVTMDALLLCYQERLSIVVHHTYQIDLLEKIQTSVGSDTLEVWLKLDTGMHRLGFSAANVQPVLQRLSKLPTVNQPVILMTHLAKADDPDAVETQHQLDLFDKLTRSYVSERSVANSAYILSPSHRQGRDRIVRPGLMLYGASPFSGQTAVHLGLRPVMRLTARIIAINPIRRGDQVGYGGIWTCSEDGRIGVVAMGYADGYPRHVRPGTAVWVNGLRCPIVGHVSMNMITIDLSHHPSAQLGDWVELWGGELPVEEVAIAAETIPYELFCRLSQHVRFHYEQH